MIQFKDVEKTFKDVYAVKGVTCEINDKEIFGLLGPNGAGKTTLIMTMATVYNPTKGEVIVDGHSASAEPDKVKSLIGISFQDPKYDRILSAREILEWHAKVTGVDKAVRGKRIDDVLDKFGLTSEARKRTWMLSGGTKKKIENAKVFVQRPKIAVFDEPTAYLDVPSRLMVWEMIDELRDEGTTVVLATNMMDEADRMSDRVGIMSRGEMVQVGEPARLKGTLKGR
ncbi:MAG TPA: ATP-binding cassette domain-containing protein, partial [Nitrososphaerales archaeon]|nr:ATP-binding cassette domain-containing protein [Nitrososphaerales archaeon]